MKTETKVAHTPGPWRFAPGEDNQVYDAANTDAPICGAICDEDGLHIARIWSDVPEAKANAHLIAAAPELLRILEAIDRFWGDGVCPAPVWPGAYLSEEDVPISDLVHLAVNRARGIVRP